MHKSDDDDDDNKTKESEARRSLKLFIFVTVTFFLTYTDDIQETQISHNVHDVRVVRRGIE